MKKRRLTLKPQQSGPSGGSAIASPPGQTLGETLRAFGITQTSLAQQMGRPIKTINEIIKGRARITEETAIGLETCLGVPAIFWLTMEANHRLAIARRNAERSNRAAEASNIKP